MPIWAMLGSLDSEIEDPEEESFLLFSQSIPSQNLGFVDSKATLIDITLPKRNITIHQSPTILSSTREGGTTGAVVWKITPLFATWITSAENILLKHSVLNSLSSVLELGCGISGIIGLALGPLVYHYTLTDQEYVMKLLKQNLLENVPTISASTIKARKGKPQPVRYPISNITARILDWETDEVASAVAEPRGERSGFDAVIACDCIYNDALIPPFIQTLVDACQLRRSQINDTDTNPTLCIIAQQLRSHEVFEIWLKAFHKSFKVWRLQDKDLSKELASNSGFVIHVGILR